MQTIFPDKPDAPLHVALSMDGNGRWATARGLPRTAGHRAGAEALRTVVEAAPGLGIGTLTCFAFSADNWRRPPEEVAGLMQILADGLEADRTRLREAGVRLTVVGRRDRLPARLAAGIAAAEADTAGGRRLILRLAIDYSGRHAIVRAAARAAAAPVLTVARFQDLLDEGRPGGPIDLVIRTGGERRLSDFMVFECAYAELWFTDVPWPAFGPDHLAAALADFHNRDRRFGRAPQPGRRARAAA